MGKSHGFLNPNDPVAISFWIISISMVASTVFFLMESMAVGGHWKTSMNVGALVTLQMLAFGYAGESKFISPMGGFVFGMAGWGFILNEIFIGEAGKIAATGVSENVKASFATMRFIVSVGWSIYPLGYFFGYLMGGVDDSTLNLVYNLADFVNKIGFCLAIWASAKKDTAQRKDAPLLP